MKASGSEHFRVLLQTELAKRCEKNPNYNLSAFARNLKMDISTLSKILRGLRPVKKNAMRRIGVKLGLHPQQIFQIEKGQSDNEFSHLDLDEFSMIADWYHYAILELMRLPAFAGDYHWIAKALQISVHEAQVAVERLVRLKMIEILPSGEWKDLSGGYSTTLGNDFTASAFKKHQHQIIDKAAKALDEVPFAERSQTSVTMAINREKIPEAKKLIIEFQRKLNRLLNHGQGENLDSVYHLGISLYPVSRDLGEGPKGKKGKNREK